MDFWKVKEPSEAFKFHLKMVEIAEWWDLGYERRGRFCGVLLSNIRVGGEYLQINCIYEPQKDLLLLEYAKATGNVLSAQIRFCSEPETIAKNIAEQFFLRIRK